MSIRNPDYEKVISGTLYPDASENNDISHYTDKNRGNDNGSHVRGKVNLYSFLEEHENIDDFKLSWFIHLVTDYLFFEECFTSEYLLEKSYENFCKDLYFAYKCLNLYLSKKYHITKQDYKNYPSEYFLGIPYQKCILSINMIDNFIARVSSINFENYIIKIKENKKNVKP